MLYTQRTVNVYSGEKYVIDSIGFVRPGNLRGCYVSAFRAEKPLVPFGNEVFAYRILSIKLMIFFFLMFESVFF